jgi:hypothetical protein
VAERAAEDSKWRKWADAGWFRVPGLVEVGNLDKLDKAQATIQLGLGGRRGRGGLDGAPFKDSRLEADAVGKGC